MLTINYARQLLDMSAACFEVQAETARQYAKTTNPKANNELAAELQHKANIIREALAHPVQS